MAAKARRNRAMLQSPIDGARLAVRSAMNNSIDKIGDDELVALVLGNGGRNRPATSVAAQLVKAIGGVAELSRATPRELALVTGVGAARATRIAAAFELGRRVHLASTRRVPIGQPEDIFRLVAPRIAGLAQEIFIVIGVDCRNGLIDVVEVARGTVLGVEVHPREVFRPLVRMAAAGGIVVHNHPSGDPTPSEDDLLLTRRLRDNGDLLGIPIIDHVVVANDSFRSIAEWTGVIDANMGE